MSRSSPNSHAFSHPRDRVIVGRRARGSSQSSAVAACGAFSMVRSCRGPDCRWAVPVRPTPE